MRWGDNLSAMDALESVAYTAALCTMLILLAAVRTIGARRRYGIALGDGGAIGVQVAMRAFANLTEYAPIFLVLQLVAALRGASESMCLFIGLIFVAGRALHLFSFSAEPNMGRMLGMMMTFGGLVAITALMLSAHGGA